jgi:hypothetical protein
MDLAVITIFALMSSTAMSILAFMIGRCARRLPIDGMLPRVVRAARFGPKTDSPGHERALAKPGWPEAD